MFLPLNPARADDDAVFAEREVSRVEEVDLPNLRTKWVECTGRCSVAVGQRHRQLQFDAAGALEQGEQFRVLGVRALMTGARRRHPAKPTPVEFGGLSVEP